MSEIPNIILELVYELRNNHGTLEQIMGQPYSESAATTEVYVFDSTQQEQGDG